VLRALLLVAAAFMAASVYVGAGDEPEAAVAVMSSWTAGLVLAWGIEHLSKTLAPLGVRDP